MIGGVREYFDKDYRKLKYILDTIEKIYASYGYRPLETSVFEDLNILLKKGGEEIREQIFRFDRIGLRFDHTVPLIRFAEEHKELPRPIKRYSIGKVYRNEDPQRMRYIEFIQADIDVVGSNSIYSTLEILEIAELVLSSLGLSAQIEVNDRRFLDGVVADLDDDQRSFLFRTVDKIGRFGERWVREQIERKGISMKYLDILLRSDLETVKDYSKEAYDTLSRIGRKFNPTLVRGLDYYTGEIFEVSIAGINVSVGGGGRYSMFSEKHNVGISLGVSRLYDLIDYKDHIRSIFIAWIDEFEYADSIAKELRKRGLAVEINTEDRSLRKQLEYASKYYGKCIIVGRKEKEEQSVVVRDLKKGEQNIISVKELLENYSKCLDQYY
ncbi:MAG: HisS family protein [Candidatus Anstonellales archaeon]